MIEASGGAWSGRVAKRRRVRRCAGLFAALVVPFAGCGPIGPIPGGALAGPVGPAQVEDWSFAADVENAQLETRYGLDPTERDPDRVVWIYRLATR